MSVQSETKTPRRNDLLPLARALLGRIRGYQDCPGHILDALVACGRIKSLGKGEVLVHSGTPVDNLTMVVQGAVETSTTRSSGHRHLVSFLQPGDLIGLIGMLDGKGHVHDLRAKGPADVLLMPLEAVNALRDKHVELIKAMEKHLATRTRFLFERLSSDSSLSLEVRLARLLQTLSNIYGLPRGDEVLLDMKISQADLGDWLGASRQRINFVIQQLQTAGLIRVSYSTLTIVDPKGLAARADA